MWERHVNIKFNCKLLEPRKLNTKRPTRKHTELNCMKDVLSAGHCRIYRWLLSLLHRKLLEGVRTVTLTALKAFWKYRFYQYNHQNLCFALSLGGGSCHSTRNCVGRYIVLLRVKFLGMGCSYHINRKIRKSEPYFNVLRVFTNINGERTPKLPFFTIGQHFAVSSYSY